MLLHVSREDTNSVSREEESVFACIRIALKAAVPLRGQPVGPFAAYKLGRCRLLRQL